MRSLWLAAKLAVILGLVLGCVHLGIFLLFVDVAGRELAGVLSRVHAYDGVAVAREVEDLMAVGHTLDSPAVEARLEAGETALDLWLTVVAAEQWNASAEAVRRDRPRLDRALDIGGRTVRVLGAPWFEVWVPILDGEDVIGMIKVRGSGHASRAHEAFHRGLIQIGIVAMLGVVVLTVFLTRPLRRMSRSMDRVAEGDLEHRVAVRGADEVAAMGRSFNAMADRIGTMVQGQKELLAGVSHELRSPLARIKVASALLREGAPEKRLDDIDAEVDALDALVGELLAASRFDLGAASLTPRTVDLASAIAAAWSTTIDESAYPDLELKMQLASGAEVVQADRALTARVLRNLFENAARYARHGTVVVSSRRRADHRVEVTVADAGPGVPEGERGRLFEPFYRADPARASDNGAVGLGLMIVQRAVAAHGGAVRADAAPGGGLAVVFDLPAGVCTDRAM